MLTGHLHQQADDDFQDTQRCAGQHGWDEDSNFMLLGISIPTLGCWEITADYHDVQLTYVVQVVEER